MKTRMTAPTSRHAHGASLVTILVAIAIIIAIAAAAWFLIVKPQRQVDTSMQPVVTSTGKKPVKKVAAPVNTAGLSTDQILAKASQAIKDQRFLAPKGNNAFELYLEVLQRQPNNQVAKQALRETFPFAANAAEQSINQGSFADAQREIALLSKADPNNYTLTILRAKLDARRKVQAQQAQLQQLAKQQAKRQAAAAAVAQVQHQQQAKQQATQLAAQQAAARKAAQTRAASQQRAAQVTQQQQQPTQTKVVIQQAVLVKKVNPNYPARARRMQRQGWVVVSYTVGVNGRVSNAEVIASHPGHLFDRAAIRAISQWQYKPALRNGKPFAVTMRKKISFTL